MLFTHPSGCGKTTHCCVRSPDWTFRPVEGGSRRVKTFPHFRRHSATLASCFQSYALFPNLTIAENIGYGLRTLVSRGPKVAAGCRTGRAGRSRRRGKISGSTFRWPATAGRFGPRVATSPGLCCWTNHCRRWMHGSACTCGELKQLQRRLGVTIDHGNSRSGGSTGHCRSHRGDEPGRY